MIEFPDSPAPADHTIGLVHFGTSTTPPLGGPTQDIERLGTRHKLTVTMPPMKNRDDGLLITSRIRQAKTGGGLRMKFPLGGFDPGDPGAPVIRLSDRTGSILFMEGFNIGYEIKEGQWFSVLTNGNHYLYSASRSVTVSAEDGRRSVDCHPLIRALHQAGDPCFFAEPMIEGRVEGQDWSWTVDTAYNAGVQFELYERK